MDETPAFLKSVDISAVRKVEIALDEIVKVFLVLEDLNQILHQSDNFNARKMEAFLVEQGGYQSLASAYYEVVWNWLPADVQQALLNR